MRQIGGRDPFPGIFDFNPNQASTLARLRCHRYLSPARGVPNRILHQVVQHPLNLELIHQDGINCRGYRPGSRDPFFECLSLHALQRIRNEVVQ